MIFTRLTRANRLTASATLLTCIAACNFIINVDPAQCKIDADCTPLFPNQKAVCDHSTCVLAPTAPPECTKNAECIEKEAAKTGRPAICVDQHCQSIVGDGELCLPQLLPLRVGEGNAKTATDLLRADDVIVIGAVTPLNDSSPLQQPNLRAYNLALKEINEYDGVPIGAGGKRQPLVMVVCKGEQGAVDPSVEHLVNKLKVPAIVPSVDVTDLPSVMAKAQAAKSFGMNPSETLDKYETYEGLAWSLLGSPEDLAQAYAPAVQAIQAHLRSKRKLTGNLKLAVVATTYTVDQITAKAIESGPTNPPGSALQRDLAKAVTLNGQPLSALATTNDPSFLHRDLNLAGGAAEQTKLVDDLVNFCPDIIVALTGEELGVVFKPVEEQLAQKWESGGCVRGDGADAGAPTAAMSLPMWLLGTRNAHPAKLFEYLNTDVPEPRTLKYQRFFGIQYAGTTEVVPAGATTQRDAWLERMKTLYGGASEDYSDMENFYDAIYWIAYGFSASGYAPVPPVGASLKGGVRNLLDGVSIFPGTVDVVRNSFATIQTQRLADKHTTYVGALGPRDIEQSVGRVFGTGALYCYVNAGSASAQPISIKYDVRRYDSEGGGKLVGDDACFVGMPF